MILGYTHKKIKFRFIKKTKKNALSARTLLKKTASAFTSFSCTDCF